jgi:transposase
MEVIHPRCCGLDIHKDSISACVLIKEDGKREKHLARFGTMTSELLELADWLRSWGVKRVAMESTGVYWKPIWNILEGEFDLELINAQHIKKVPGRKTDTKDCEWVGELVQHGLVKASFVPPQAQRDLRELTRYRAVLCEDKVRVANRIQKVLEDANLKLGSVASDVLGASGRAMLEALIQGEQSPEQLAQLAKQRLRDKLPELKRALQGRVREHHRFLLRQLLDEIYFMESKIKDVEQRLEQQMSSFYQAVMLWKTIPGVSEVTAWSLVAEVGVDLTKFERVENLAAWAGLCPGNHESGGKRLSGKARKGDRWLRRVLTQAAWAAVRSRDTYLGARFRRLASRRGRKRALLAIAHKILVVAFWMLKTGCPFRDLGADYFDRLKSTDLTRSLVRRLERLGYKVALETVAA